MNTILEDGDIDEALSAAHAVGDDAIQSKMQGHIVPESFTHGTSEQRKYWFMKGYKTGDLNQGNSFDAQRYIQPLKTRPIPYFFYFLLQLSTPI
jgi:predicted metalloprotease